VNIAALAASYSFGLTRNHPFHDGNQRTSLHVADLFDVDAIHSIIDFAADHLSEPKFAA
jgi:death-on-curing protein